MSKLPSIFPGRRCIAVSVVMLLMTATRLAAQAPDPEWLRGLEELMQVEVTSASRREQKLADTAAAVFVLTAEDIRRSGVMTVPELLRLVPGVHVARIDGNKWAVSVRGFNSRWANKLLVMIDGRSIYSRLFSGVFWDAIGVPVSEIERIEVIRGPGGSLWGANAMNGVINIITRKPKAREGAASVSLGSLGTSSGSVRYASSLGKRAQFHAYVDATHQGVTLPETSHDDSRNVRGGAGAVVTVSRRDEIRVESRALDGIGWSLMDQSLTSLMPPRAEYLPGASKTSGISAAATWTRNMAAAGALDTAVNVEHLRRAEGPIQDDAQLFEVTVQHTVPRRRRHEVTWGVATQHARERVVGTETFRLSSPVAHESIFGVFGQDEIFFAADRLTLTLGTKLERMQSTGWHWQPTVRARWHPSSQQTVWAAVSRAVRTPSLIDRGLRMQQVFGMSGGARVILDVSGNPSMPAESLQAHEAGYRWTARRLSVDMAAYHNAYDGLGTAEPGTPRVQISPGRQPVVVYPVVFDNRREATSYGAEFLATVTPASRFRFITGYTLFRVSSRLAPQSRDRDGAAAFDADTPRHQGTVRSLVSLPYRVDIDTSIALVGELRRMRVPAYGVVDARVGWRSPGPFGFALVAQNVLDANQVAFESAGTFVVSSQMRRRVWATATWRF